MKQIVRRVSILFLISISLIGCTSKEERRLQEFKSLKHLADAKILFYYDRIEGLDSSGPVYYVLDFKDKEKDFIDQFYNAKTGENSLKKGPDTDFEWKVNEFVQQWIGFDYLTFDEEYQIDFEKTYEYYSPSLEPLEIALIYYAETSTAYLLYLEM